MPMQCTQPNNEMRFQAHCKQIMLVKPAHRHNCFLFFKETSFGIYKPPWLSYTLIIMGWLAAVIYDIMQVVRGRYIADYSNPLQPAWMHPPTPPTHTYTHIPIQTLQANSAHTTYLCTVGGHQITWKCNRPWESKQTPQTHTRRHILTPTLEPWGDGANLLTTIQIYRIMCIHHAMACKLS